MPDSLALSPAATWRPFGLTNSLHGSCIVALRAMSTLPPAPPPPNLLCVTGGCSRLQSQLPSSEVQPVGSGGGQKILAVKGREKPEYFSSCFSSSGVSSVAAVPTTQPSLCDPCYPSWQAPLGSSLSCLKLQKLFLSLFSSFQGGAMV